MRTFLAVFGAVTLALWLLGAFGIGHTVTIYSQDPVTCFINGKKVRE